MSYVHWPTHVHVHPPFSESGYGPDYTIIISARAVNIARLAIYIYCGKNDFLFLSSILLVELICVIQAETEEGVVYYVSPTEPLSSCPGNSSCLPGQLCHTMDYLAEHGHEFFLPDQVNVMLIFMCGVHNYTKDLTVQNLHSFVMKGDTGSRDDVIRLTINYLFYKLVNP